MKIINISDVSNPGWRWIEPCLKEKIADWFFYTSSPANWLEKNITRPRLGRIRAVLQGVMNIRRGDIVVIHGPYLGFYFGLFNKFFRKSVRSIIYSFNFTSLPHGFSRSRMAYSFKSIDKFVVYSTMEKKLYAQWFNIPEHKIDIRLWGVEEPQISRDRIIDNHYITAIGGNSRDYHTMMEAMRLLPDIKLVAVMRPHNLKGLDVPDNVEVRTNIPRDEANNILGHADFMVLPLIGSEIPCGHVTLVAAMYMGTPSIVTNSTGIDDYVKHNENAIIVEASSPTLLASAIEELWGNPKLLKSLADNGKEFVGTSCTENSIVNHFACFLEPGCQQEDLTSG